jgi:hypothetical protein
MTRQFGLKLLLAVALLGLTAWIVSRTEWVDVQMPTTPHGEAAHDSLYAVKKLLARLGAHAVSPLNLDKMPPAGATLVLSSRHWSLFPGRDGPLRRWVESGGHLVIDDALLADEKLSAWIPIQIARPPAAASAPPPRGAPAGAGRCAELAEAGDLPGAYGAPRSYRICSRGFRTLKASGEVLWSLAGPQGAEFLRVPVGRGMVTARTGFGLFDNLELFRADHALAAVAALRLQPGAEVWFVDAESRPPLLSVIWHSGAPVVLLGALVIGLAIWRGAPRFGPPAPTPPTARRSVAEQIRGTAHFIWQRNGSALHRAQLRALDDAARSRVPQLDRLDRRHRAEAIARLTAVDAQALQRAMDTTLASPRGALPNALAVLESARRRLLAR